MAVFMRPDGKFYSYDFRFDGKRYSGSTGETDIEKSRRFEQCVRDELAKFASSFCWTLIKRAKTKIPQSTKAETGYVYMFRSGYFVKIGHSHDPAERLKKLNTGNPHDCELLFCFRASQQLEQKMHREFAACHHKREWFFHLRKAERIRG